MATTVSVVVASTHGLCSKRRLRLRAHTGVYIEGVRTDSISGAYNINTYVQYTLVLSTSGNFYYFNFLIPPHGERLFIILQKYQNIYMYVYV